MPPPSAPARSGTRAAAAVSIAHGFVDAYVGFLPPLLPRLMVRLGLSIAPAATLAMSFSLASSLMQPVAGWLADRYGRRAFVVGGPVVCAVFLSLIGFAPTYGALLGLLILGGLGSAAFHPPAASLAARVGQGAGSGVRMSVFSFGGAVGYALGPLVVVALVAQRGLPGIWIAMVPALLLAPVLFALLPAGHDAAPHRTAPTSGELRSALAGPLGLVFAISAIGAFVQRVYLTLAPIVIAEGGGSEAAGAVALSTFLGAQALGTVFGGIMTDRADRRLLLVWMTLAAVPAQLAAFWLSPATPWGLVAAAVAGFFNMAILPPVVVMAQEMLPSRAALGSGIVMGLAWAVGSIGVMLTGVLADVVGARSAALMSVPVLLIAPALAMHPSLRRHARGRAHADALVALDPAVGAD